MTPFEVVGIKQGRHIRLVGFDNLVGCRVGDGTGVVLIGEASEVMPELMYKQVRRPLAVGSSCAKQAVDAATAISLGVGQDLNEIVGRGRRNAAHRLVVERQNVALGVK